MQRNKLDLNDQILPPSPVDEIPRDGYIRQIVSNFSPQCQHQMVVGSPQTGKTNLLVQFVRYHKGRCVSYFITSNPWTQRQHTYLYTMCNQLAVLLNTQPVPERIELEALKSLFSTLVLKFTTLAKSKNTQFYFVVDGLEWGMIGPEGDRIIDLFPPQTSARSPYLLSGIRTDVLSRLPNHAKCKPIELVTFSALETQNYLRDSGLKPEEIDRIQQKYKGVPGYLKVIKETKLANPDFNIESAPVELDRLITDQVESVFGLSDQSTKDTLEILATSPSSVSAKILAELTQVDQTSLVRSLEQTSLIKLGSSTDRLEYSNEITQDIVKKKLGHRVKEVRTKLIDLVKTKYPEDEFLLDELLQENQDYDGLQSLLAPQSLITSIDTTGDISNIIKRLKTASELAVEKDDTEGLVRWTLGISTAKAFVTHVANPNEIRALIAIGETKEALKRAYAVPELAGRIRLLARAYTSMKENGERIPKEAREELHQMVKNIELKNLDRGIAQGIAIDLFPIFPDTAMSLMEKITEQGEKQSIVETAMEIIATELSDQGESGVATSITERKDPNYARRLFPTWLRKLTYRKLIDEIRSVENTKAKEYMIRQWCRQNAQAPEIVAAIDLWLDTVIGDRDFVVLLRSLRQISNVVIRTPLSDRRRLIDRLQVPGFTSLDSPREE